MLEFELCSNMQLLYNEERTNRAEQAIFARAADAAGRAGSGVARTPVAFTRRE